MTNLPNTLSFSEAAQRQLAKSLYESWLKSPEALKKVIYANEAARESFFSDMAAAAEQAAWYIYNPDL